MVCTEHKLPVTLPISVRLLRSKDTAPLLAFELENKDWFEQWVPARPGGYYTLDALHQINAALIEEANQDSAYIHVILDAADTIIGRVNLSEINRGDISSADLGYRVGKNLGKQGVGTNAVRAILKLAAQTYRLNLLTAHCLEFNPASSAVLGKTGFTQVSQSKSEIPGFIGVQTILYFERSLDADYAR